MRLRSQGAPRAGDYFKLSITEVAGTAHLEWFIDGNLVNTTDCDDPPCYEQMYIAPHFDGGELHIIGTDQSETKELRIRIAGKNTTPTATATA